MGLTKASTGIFLTSIIILTFILLSTKVMSIGFIPDDGFYYLTLAKHFSQSGSWTFDGINVTNGFHMLWGYLLAAVSFILRPSVTMFPILAILLSLIILSASIFYIGYKENITSILWLAFLVTSSGFILNTVSLTEYCLVIICAYCVITNKQPFLFSILGVLSRTEFVIIPLVVFGVSIFSKKINIEHLLGGALGLAIVMSHNYIIAGTPVQSSALIKMEWSKYYPQDLLIDKSLSLTANYIYHIIDFKKIIFAALLLVSVAAVRFGKISKTASRELVISVVVILAFTLSYSNNAGVQSWYGGVFFIPLFLIGKHLFGMVNKNLAVVIILIGIAAHVFYKYEVPYPHEEIMQSAGEFLSKNKLDGRVGSWNAGIIGYYQGGSIVNLDGLVNNSIYPYITNGTVTEYLKKENIKYIVDFQNMFEAQFPKQGGYPDLKVKRLMHFDNGTYWWKCLSIWLVD